MVTIEPKNWSYFNFLETLLAGLPIGDYSADVGDWSQAIAELRQKYEDGYPELFAEIHFVIRPKSRAYSRQVSDFFVSQAFGGLKKVMNPAYEKMSLDMESKEELTKRNEYLLKSYEEVIQAMVADLESKLAIAPSLSSQ